MVIPGLEPPVIDQRDIQRRGGVCVMFPTSCLIYDMLRDVGFVPEMLAVLDVTYGEGRFYGAWRPRLLLGSDIRVLNWVVHPDWFTVCPSWSVWQRVQKLGIKPDLVVVDPPFSPWNRGKEYRRHYLEKVAAFGSKEDILWGGIKTARKIGANYVLIHYSEKPEGLESIVIEKWFKPVTRYINNPGFSHVKTWFGIIEVKG